MKKFTALAVLLSLALLVPTVHAEMLTPALNIITAKSTMIKTGNPRAGVTFTEEDFRNVSSLDTIESVTLTSLPVPTEGVLYLGSVPASVNQEIAGENLDALHFVPANGASSGSFTFSYDNECTINCNMIITDQVNFEPLTNQADVCRVWTQKDITCWGTLNAYDPEGDALIFEIVQAPRKGLLVMTDESHGDFRYTPYVGCSGKDTFTYRVRDSYGNYSAEAEAEVNISGNSARLVFADMSEHWAHSAAIEMVSEGIMDYETVSGMAVFSPDETVTREDFLVMVVKALGYEGDADEVQTVFADDSEIETANKEFVDIAYKAGIIRGSESNGQLCFMPKNAITRAEAAVIMNNIIGAEVPVNVSAFSDIEDVPVWARGSLYALSSLGIMKGTGAGSIASSSVITRAQAAQILLNFTKYIG